MEALIQNNFTTRSQLIGAYIYELIAGYMVFLWFQGHEYMIFFYLEATNLKILNRIPKEQKDHGITNSVASW